MILQTEVFQFWKAPSFRFTLRKMLKNILWDNDGTLIDTATLFCDANRVALLSKNILMDEKLFVKISQKQGKSILEYYALKNSWNEKQLKELYLLRQSKYTEMLKNGAALNYEAFNLIECLKQKGIKNFMVTGSSKNELLLEYSKKSDLLALFDDIITADDCDRPKPHPDSLLLIIKKWHLYSNDSVVIDDLPRGIIAARKAGLKAIRYNPFVKKSKYASFSKLLYSLENIANK